MSDGWRRWFPLWAACAAGCGTRYVQPSAQSSGRPVTLRVDGVFPLGAPCAAADQIHAELLFAMGASTCALAATVSADNDTISVAGECDGVPSTSETLILRYLALGASGAEYVVGEARGQANLGAATADPVIVSFDAMQNAALAPKTAATATDDTATQVRFNCDEYGSDACAIGSPLPMGGMIVLDTCSNLQELCRGTLFSAELSFCGDGP